MHVFFFGDIAQLVERLNGIEKVRGSTPLISTIKIPKTLSFGIFFCLYNLFRSSAANFGNSA